MPIWSVNSQTSNCKSPAVAREDALQPIAVPVAGCLSHHRNSHLFKADFARRRNSKAPVPLARVGALLLKGGREEKNRRKEKKRK